MPEQVLIVNLCLSSGFRVPNLGEKVLMSKLGFQESCSPPRPRPCGGDPRHVARSRARRPVPCRALAPSPDLCTPRRHLQVLPSPFPEPADDNLYPATFWEVLNLVFLHVLKAMVKMGVLFPTGEV